LSRVLVVGMADSIHLARWLEQFEDEGYEFTIISSSPHRKVHPKINRLIDLSGQVGKSSYRLPWVSRYLSLPMWILDRAIDDFFRGALVLAFARLLRPSFIHVNELQNAGYATLKAYKLARGGYFPKIFSTNYGSDLVWFRSFPGHLTRLKALLGISKAFSAECARDYKLARELGFTGLEMPLMPVAGGGRFAVLDFPSRKTIAIKGYQNRWGRALTVLDVVEAQAEMLGDFKIELFSCNRSVIRRAKELRLKTNLDIVYHPKGSLSHDDMMKLFSRSIAYIGFSMSDGISTSMLEAMANGAIPIQTCTSCADEWITNKQSGFILAPDDAQGLAQALKDLIQNNFDQEQARGINQRVITEKYDPDKLKKIALGQYSKMLAFRE
jgi:hypothetical protein